METCYNEMASLLLIDDSLAEVVLLQSALKRDNVHLNFKSIRNSSEITLFLSDENFIDSKEDIPDIILLDLSMPAVDGKDILNKIKSSRYLSDVPVIIYSGSDAPKDKESTLSLGATHFMIKTINLKKLKLAIKDIANLEIVESQGSYYLNKKNFSASISA